VKVDEDRGDSGPHRFPAEFKASLDT
jgi:hypothetical protein